MQIRLPMRCWSRAVQSVVYSAGTVLLVLAAARVLASASPPNTVDLAIAKVVFDPTRNLPNHFGNRRQFAVDVKVESLTGRIQNNTYMFRVNLYWARGIQPADRIGLAATGRFTFNHQSQTVGTTVSCHVPTHSTSTYVYRQPAAAAYLVAELTDFTITETDASDNVISLRVPTAAELATRVLANGNVTLATAHSKGFKDSAYARTNIQDVAAGRPAQRSSYKDGSLQAPGGKTELDPRMLNGLLELARQYRMSISEVAGGAHSANSPHYKGLAIDVTHINGAPVSANNSNVAAFRARAVELGANKTHGPGEYGYDSHARIEWPNDAELTSTTSSP